MSEAIGAMRARVALQSPQRVADEIGGAAIVWSDEGDAWARIEARAAVERATFDGLGSEATFRVELHRREGVRGGWRLVWGERVLRIVGVVDDGGARIELACVEERL